MKKIAANLWAYLALIGSFFLGAWFIWRGMEALSYILTERKANTIELYQSAVGRQSGFIVMSWAVLMGLPLLIFMVFAESYFRKGIDKGDLARRIAIIYSPELLLIFIADLVVLISRGWSGSWIYWSIMTVELVVGLLLFLYGRGRRRPGVGVKLRS